MSFKNWIKRICYGANRASREEIIEAVKSTRGGVERNCREIQLLQEQLKELSIQVSRNKSEESGLIQLEGCQYSRYAVPLDYMPSRDLRPRWGYLKPVIPQLQEWFSEYDDKYEEMLKFMKEVPIGHIPVSYSKPGQAAWTGGAVCAFDALCLYSMVLKNQPKHYVEIGSGMTTCFARQAVMDGHLDTKIISIDPEPRMEIENLCDAVYREGLEKAELTKLSFLEAGDILFFDGSHRSFMNSDVTVFFIDILPNIKPGVIIHLHDILLPYDYPDMFVHWYWNEQYMLAAAMLNGMEQMVPLMPTCYICRNPKFDSYFAEPFLDLNGENDSWRGGGSMWFMYR